MQEAGISSMKTQLRSTRKDQGSKKEKNYQMALSHCKGSERKGTNGWHIDTCCVCICMSTLFFFLCLDYYGFKFLCKIKVSEAELLANCRTRDSTKGAFLEGKF